MKITATYTTSIKRPSGYWKKIFSATVDSREELDAAFRAAAIEAARNSDRDGHLYNEEGEPIDPENLDDVLAEIGEEILTADQGNHAGPCILTDVEPEALRVEGYWLPIAASEDRSIRKFESPAQMAQVIAEEFGLYLTESGELDESEYEGAELETSRAEFAKFQAIAARNFAEINDAIALHDS